jgi:NADH-quinone oxidoreductase subunit N
MWAPDVYEGAPTPITAFLSVGSKSAGFAIILRIFFSAFALPSNLSSDWGMVFAILAVITMTIGNVIAIQQSNIKRMLGYSSIAQAGYIMVGLAAVGFSPVSVTTGQSSILFFLASYSLTNLGAFIAIVAISNKVNSDLIDDYSGAAKRSPLLALALTLCLVSLIGLPPAAGFIAKFYLFGAAVQHNLLWLVVVAILNSVISAYYYLRVVKVMWTGQPASAEKIDSSIFLKVALGLSCLGVLVLFFIPRYVMELAQIAARMLGF